MGCGFFSEETSEVTNVTDPPASLACLGEGRPSQLRILPQPSPHAHSLFQLSLWKPTSFKTAQPSS